MTQVICILHINAPKLPIQSAVQNVYFISYDNIIKMFKLGCFMYNSFHIIVVTVT